MSAARAIGANHDKGYITAVDYGLIVSYIYTVKECFFQLQTNYMHV